jgi:hypothetical protein
MKLELCPHLSSGPRALRPRTQAEPKEIASTCGQGVARASHLSQSQDTGIDMLRESEMTLESTGVGEV